MVILYILIGILLCIWAYGFYISNDLSVRSGDLTKYKHILVIFPHPDDETLSSGGLLKNLSSDGTHITAIVFTKGERGNEDAHLDDSLKITRSGEVKNATDILGIQSLILEDFGDGQLPEKRKQLTAYIEKVILKKKPDAILTYDLSGLYGHADHIVVSEIITELIDTKFKTIKLIYPSLPKRIFSMIKLPEHMAKNSEYSKRRVLPSIKIWIGGNIFFRIRAMYAYKSQLYSFRKSFPIPAIPLWFYYSMQLFEYYYEAN